MSAYPALENFFSAYFHQDWAVEHADADAVLAYYLDGEPEAEVAKVRAELEALRGRELDEAALGQALASLGSSYDPAADGHSRAGWLQRLAEGLAAR